jgi:hypothetical protein
MNASEKFKSQPWECDFRTHPAKSPLCAVFMESRNHPDLEYALRNFSCMMPFCTLFIFHTDTNYQTIKDIVGPDTNIHFRKLKEPYTFEDFVVDNFDPKFWAQFLDHDRFLFIHCDTGIRHNSILKFMHYDYIGAHWNHLPTGDPRVFQGNGGFSLRDPKFTMEIMSRFPRPNPTFVAEDVWVVHNMVHHYPNAVLPTKAACAEFSTEGNDIDGTMGFHDTQKYTPGAWRVYQVADGPSRKLYNVANADVDGRDVTAFVRLGVGPNGLRIFKETRFGSGDQLRINNLVFKLHNGRLLEDLHLTTST